MQSSNKTVDLLTIALTELEKANQNNAQVGACIFTPPSGRPQCFQMTPQQCKAIKGLYVGGPCSSSAIDINKPLGASTLPDSPVVEKDENPEEDCTCTHGGQSYAKGAVICMNGKQHKCGCNGWTNIGFNC